MERVLYNKGVPHCPTCHRAVTRVKSRDEDYLTCLGCGAEYPVPGEVLMRERGAKPML